MMSPSGWIGGVGATWAGTVFDPSGAGRAATRRCAVVVIATSTKLDPVPAAVASAPSSNSSCRHA
jgi:hypothetical protein